MIFTNNYGFPCPEDTDYAALPLYMQRLAEQIEEKVLTQRAQINGLQRPQTAIWKGPTSAIGPFPLFPNGVAQISFSSDQLLFSNYTVNGAQPRWSSFSGATFNASGVWHVGLFITMTAAGAVTNDSHRECKGGIIKRTSNGLVLVADMGRRVNGDTNQTTEFFTMEQVVFVDQEFNNYAIDMWAEHGNAASDMSIPAFGMMGWVTRISDTSVIEVV